MDTAELPEAPSGAANADAHGRAALLLVESLIHELAAQSILSFADAVSVMEIALDTQLEMNEDAVEPSASMRDAATLLSTLLNSMRADLPD